MPFFFKIHPSSRLPAASTSTTQVGEGNPYEVPTTRAGAATHPGRAVVCDTQTRIDSALVGRPGPHTRSTSRRGGSPVGRTRDHKGGLRQSAKEAGRGCSRRAAEGQDDGRRNSVQRGHFYCFRPCTKNHHYFFQLTTSSI